MVLTLAKKYEKVLKKAKRKKGESTEKLIWILVGIIMIILSYFYFTFYYKYYFTKPWFAYLAGIIYLILSLGIGLFRDKLLYVNFTERRKAKFLHSLLKSEGISKPNQIVFLGKCAKEISDSLKVTKYLFEPLYTFFTSILLQLLLLIIQWVLSKTDFSMSIINLFLIVLLHLIYLLGIYYVIKPSFESLIDKNYYKMKEFQRALDNVYLFYYC